MNLTIRPLRIDDIQLVAQIEQASRPTPWSSKQFEAELENSNSRPQVLIDTQNSGVIGYVIPWIIAGEVQIQNIVVAESNRGQGLGSLLLNVALNIGFEAGCNQAILEVRESNAPAIHLYHQYQFVIVGRRENYYRDGEAALLMTAGPFLDDSSNNGHEDQLMQYREFISKQATQLHDRLQFHID